MRKLLSIVLSAAVGCLGVISVAAGDARAQEQIASVGKSVSDLKEDYRRLRAIEIPADAPREVRDAHAEYISEQRAQLSARLRTRLGTFRRYRSTLAGPLAEREGPKLDEVIRQLEGDLRELAAEAAAAGSPAAEPARMTPAAAAAPPEPAAALQDFPGNVSITTAKIPGHDAYDKDKVTLKIDGLTAARPVDAIRIEVQNRGRNVGDSPKTRTLRASDINAGITETITLAEGLNNITVRVTEPSSTTGVKTLSAIYLNPAATTPAATPDPVAFNLAAARTAAALTQEGEYDWGRVRAYFTGGLIFSKERDEFSKSDLALSFVLDKNYFQRKKWNLNTFFEARLTSIPVTAVTPAPGASPTATPTPVPANQQVDTFVTNKKAGFAQAGVYLPVNLNGWRNQGRQNSLFIAPLAKGGVQTIVGDRRSPEAVVFGDDDVYNFFSLGMRLGHFRYRRLTKPLCPKRDKMAEAKKAAECRKKADDGDPATPECEAPVDEDKCDRYENYAPELISWLDLTTGRWENFELDIPTGDRDATGNAITTRHRRWRYQAEGRLKIPETPFMVGFDGNFGKGPDDLRFGFGVRFDVGRVIRALKLVDIFDNPATAPVTPPPANNQQQGGRSQ